MKKIKKITLTIVSSLVLSLIFVQGASAEEMNLVNSKNPSFNSDGPNDSHEQFAGQALEILKNDKGELVESFYEDYRDTLLAYCDMPDKDEKDYTFAYHFYDPYKQKNYLPGVMKASKTTAMTKFKEHITNAVNNYIYNKEESMQELGRAVHYLEDVNVPHHASNQIAGVSSHMKYEKYISENNSKFFVNTSDAYDKSSNDSFDEYCTSILDECAKNAYSYKDVGKSYKEEDWDNAAYPTIKLAQENIASLFNRFYNEVNK